MDDEANESNERDLIARAQRRSSAKKWEKFVDVSAVKERESQELHHAEKYSLVSENMDSTLGAAKTDLLRQLQCAICLQGLKDTRICPRCSGLFCTECIFKWMQANSNTCPCCRTIVFYKDLVRGRAINQMRESVTKLFHCMDADLCASHRQNLNLFCYACEVKICGTCWFSPAHANHQERVGPLDKTYDQYKQDLNTTVQWMTNLNNSINQELQQLTVFLQQLNADPPNAVEAGLSCAALTNMLNVVGTIGKHCSNAPTIRVPQFGASGRELQATEKVSVRSAFTRRRCLILQSMADYKKSRT